MTFRILFFLLLPVWLFAAPSPAPLSVRLLGGETPPEGVSVAQGSRQLPVEVRSYEPGAVLPLAVEDGALVFYRTSASARAGVPPERTRLGAAAIPPGLRSVLLVFVPAEPAAGGDPWRVLVFDNDERAFPAGAMRVINLSPFPLALKLGPQSELIAPLQVRTISPEVDGKYRVFSRFAAQRPDGGWRLFHEGPLSLRPQRRMTCLVAFSSSVLAARDEDGPRLSDGRPAPDLVIVPWQDYVPVPAGRQVAGLR